jgi:hypothetical protein
MTTITPNAPSAANVENAPVSDQTIFEKMTAMREQTLRNQIRKTDAGETGESAQATAESPVAPEEPEVESPQDDVEQAAVEAVAPDEADESADQVSAEAADSTAEELIDFIEFAETNPNAKFKFMRNGKEVVIDAKKAASILGQGGAIHEEARQLKIERSEFDEYIKETRARQEGLMLAMEFTVEPKLKHAYDEILRTQNYQTTFQQQLAQTQDAAEQARIRASMEQNERYIAQQSQVIGQLRPAVEQFREVRRQQVSEVLEANRRQFKDKELRNEYVYNELRDKVAKLWPGAQEELMPGIKNLDLISSDEVLMGLVRDGLKYRDRPAAKQAGASIAALTRTKTAGQNTRAQDDIAKLREQAKGGDKKAADNLLVAQLQKLRSARTGR